MFHVSFIVKMHILIQNGIILKGAVARKRNVFKFKLHNVVILELIFGKTLRAMHTILIYRARGTYTRSRYTNSKYRLDLGLVEWFIVTRTPWLRFVLLGPLDLVNLNC